jgi:quercetin dioxygenase-like cupin family protein
MRLPAILVFVTLALRGQSLAPIIDNEQVVVVKSLVRSGPGTSSPADRDRVLILLPSGAAQWMPAGENPPAGAGRISAVVTVTLKKPADPSKSATGPLDPTRLDPQHYRVEFENAEVRVIRAKIGAGESAPFHEHKLNRVGVYLTDQNFRVTSEDGQTSTAQHRPGDVGWSGPARHSEQNLGDKPFEIVVVELKN